MCRKGRKALHSSGERNELVHGNGGGQRHYEHSRCVVKSGSGEQGPDGVQLCRQGLQGLLLILQLACPCELNETLPLPESAICARHRSAIAMNKTLLSSVILLLCSLNAFAEGACPAGEYPQQGPGWQGCVPIPGYQKGQPAQAQDYFRSHFGALAADAKAGVIGATTSASSLSSAEAIALKECKEKGGSSCDVYASVENACIAMIVGKSTLNAKAAKRKEDAEQAGMSLCNSGDTGCVVYYSECASPYRAN